MKTSKITTFAAFLPYLGRTGKKSTKDLKERSEMKSNHKVNRWGRVRDNETNRPQHCRKAVHTKSEKCYSLEGRGITDRSVSLFNLMKKPEGYRLERGEKVLSATVVDHIWLILVPESTQVPMRM